MIKRWILVKTCRAMSDRREACLVTWAGRLALEGCPVFFVEGGHEKESVIPAGNGCNLIRIRGNDDYNSISFKLRDALRILLTHEEPDAADLFTHLFVADDNTFVHWRRWIDFRPNSPFVGMNSPRIAWVHGGAGWHMNRKCCELYVRKVRQRRFSGDDVLCTEIFRRAGIELENRPELFAHFKEDGRVAADNRLITCHYVDPDEMRSLFQDTYELL